MTAADIVQKYITFFTKRGHTQIPNSSLVPENDPTTLFTSSGMQPLVPYLLGEEHPQGKRLVNVQNSFRAQDIEEIGDNRHTTFFRMIGNWSLGDYFKKDQLPWFFQFLTDSKEGLGLPVEKLYVTVFAGNASVARDDESISVWKELFSQKGIDTKVVEDAEEKGMQGGRIFTYGDKKNWWSRSGVPDNMPVGEPGGPDSEVFFEFDDVEHDPVFGKNCHVNCDCGRYLEIGNSVFMQFKKTQNEFEELPQKNVDFGGGLERLLAAYDNTPDVFKTNLFYPIIKVIEKITGASYADNAREMRIITDHFLGAVFISSNNVYPSNKEQGYILRRLIRRGLDNVYALNGKNIEKVMEAIVAQYKDTDPILVEKYEHIKGVILEEEQSYKNTMANAKQYLEKRYQMPKGEKEGNELMGVVEISAEDAFKLYTSYGLSPTQIKSLGYIFNDQEFAQKMKEHADVSRAGVEKKFRGGLADHEEKTIHGHTATHILHKALRDKFGEQLFQRGSNITTERVRFDFNFDRKITPEEITEIEDVVNQKIKENLPVYYKIIPLEKARELGAIGLFGEKYEDTVKVYFIGGDEKKIDEFLIEGSSTEVEQGSSEVMNDKILNQGSSDVGNQGKNLSTSGRSNTPLRGVYSIEFCGGPHVEHTGVIKSFKITKEEGLGKGIRRIYSVVE